MRAGDVTAMVGGTPLVRLAEASERTGALVLGKLEGMNPSGSTKDRSVLAMLRHAEAEGRLGEGGWVVVASAGNTAVSAAILSASRGYRCLVVVPDGVAQDWRRLVQGLGAELVVTPGEEGMGGAGRRAQHESRVREGAVLLQPFTDPAAVTAYVAMGEEIWRDTDGRVDRIVVGVGTAATVAGLGRFVRTQAAPVALVAVEPAGATNLSGAVGGRPHRLTGIGAGFVPPHWLNAGAEQVVAVDGEAAFAQCRRLASREGLLVGPSSGAVVLAAGEVARPGEVVVAVLADRGERYVTQAGFVDEADEPA